MVYQTIFWISIAIIIYTYLGHPITLYLAAKLFPKKWKFEDNNNTIAIYISAFNEEKAIGKKIENLLEQDIGRPFQIIIANDGSKDRTAEIVRMYNDPRIILYDFKENRGKAAMQNEIVPHIKSDIVVFSDATSIWPKDTLKRILYNFKDKNVGCVTIDLIFEKRIGGSVEKGQGFYWKYERFLRKYGAIFWTNIVASGTTYAIRAELFGGVEDDVGEDLVNPLKIAIKGKRVIFDPNIVVAETSSASHQSEFKMRTRIANRNVAGLFKFWRFLNPEYGFAAYQFLVHKYFRVFCWIPIFIAFSSNLFLIGDKIYNIILVTQIVFYSLAIAGYIYEKHNKKVRLLFIPYYFSLLNYACMIGFIQYCKGIRRATWTPAR